MTGRQADAEATNAANAYPDATLGSAHDGVDVVDGVVYSEGYMDVGGPYPDGLYDYGATADGLPGADALDEEHIEGYRRDGFLVVHDVFSPAQVASAVQAVTDIVAGRVRGYRGGIQWERGGRAKAEALPPDDRVDFVRKLHEFVAFEPRLRAFSEDPAVVGIARRLVADDLVPVQDMALLKPPDGVEKPWHQDAAFFGAVDVPMVGVWIALDEVTPDSGCMRILRGGHTAPRPHFRRRDWQMCDGTVDPKAVVAVPLRPGGCLFFDSMTPHGTPRNTTRRRRRALQFHYKAASAPAIRHECRLAHFGGDARGASC